MITATIRVLYKDFEYWRYNSTYTGTFNNEAELQEFVAVKKQYHNLPSEKRVRIERHAA